MTAQTETKTLTIERTMNAPAERIYRTYLDPQKAAAFLAAGGEVEMHEMDATVGGRFHYTMKGYPGGRSQAFEGEYLELEEFTRIRHSYRFVTDHPAMATPMEITITLHEKDGKTLFVFEQVGIPAPIPVEGATQGWNVMLDGIQSIVEA